MSLFLPPSITDNDCILTEKESCKSSAKADSVSNIQVPEFYLIQSKTNKQATKKLKTKNTTSLQKPILINYLRFTMIKCVQNKL